MQEQELQFDSPVNPSLANGVKEREERSNKVRVTKKSRILNLYAAGIDDIGEIARIVRSQPSYVANVLQRAGLLKGYFDLYTTTARDQNLYSRHFRNVLAFKTVEAAKESVSRIARLYDHFERIGDHAGQHHAEVLALTGRNRARWSGKTEESRIFEEWLFNH